MRIAPEAPFEWITAGSVDEYDALACARAPEHREKIVDRDSVRAHVALVPDLGIDGQKVVLPTRLRGVAGEPNDHHRPRFDRSLRFSEYVQQLLRRPAANEVYVVALEAQ